MSNKTKNKLSGMFSKYKKILLIALLIFSVLDLLTGVVFANKSFPNIRLGGDSFGMENRAQIMSKTASKELKNKDIILKIFGQDIKTNATELGLYIDPNLTTNAIYDYDKSGGAGLFKLVNHLQKGSSNLSPSFYFDSSKLTEFVRGVEQKYSSVPQNAYINIDGLNVSIVSEKAGKTIVDKDIILALQKKYVDGSGMDNIFSDKPLEISVAEQPWQPVLRAKDLEQIKNDILGYSFKNITLTYNGKSFNPTKEDIAHMIDLPDSRTVTSIDQYKPSLSKQKIIGYIGFVANKIDKAPVNKKIKIQGGEKTVEREGINGLSINQEAATNILYDSFFNSSSIEVPLTANTVAFKVEYNSVPATDGKYIEINVTTQRLYAYEKGNLIFQSAATTGATGKGFPTIEGTFAIYSKQRDRYLNGAAYGASYNVFVNYWMPFYSGYGLHDAKWRRTFGGPDYYNYGSHGCVNLPDNAASFLYEWAEVGTTVWTHS